jgi:hypothetical protein
MNYVWMSFSCSTSSPQRGLNQVVHTDKRAVLRQFVAVAGCRETPHRRMVRDCVSTSSSLASRKKTANLPGMATGLAEPR